MTNQKEKTLILQYMQDQANYVETPVGVIRGGGMEFLYVSHNTDNINVHKLRTNNCTSPELLASQEGHPQEALQKKMKISWYIKKG
jgi:hypothetical protein